MHRPSSAACKAEDQGPPALSPLPSAFGILPRLAFRRPAGYILPRHMQGNRAGNRFPLASRQGFLYALPPFPLGPHETPEHQTD